MFTGIIEELGIFRGLQRSGDNIVILIECAEVLKDLNIGDSVAVNGACLTVSFFGQKSFTADVMPETLRKTNIGNLKDGSYVNLERAMKASSRFGGHIVSGHIDGVAIIEEIKQEKNAILISFNASREITKYVVQKGSVAIDGVGLTVTFISNDTFGVSLIPLTANLTALGFKKIGDEVNIECDIIGKYVEKFMIGSNPNSQSKVTETFLKEHGFA